MPDLNLDPKVLGILDSLFVCNKKNADLPLDQFKPVTPNSKLKDTGDLEIAFSGELFKLPDRFLNVDVGNNVFQIKYYGSCIKYKE